jgi:hypothetical protein
MVLRRDVTCNVSTCAGDCESLVVNCIMELWKKVLRRDVTCNVSTCAGDCESLVVNCIMELWKKDIF